MRDKNLNQIQFNIQLERKIKSSFLTDEKFLTRPVFVTPTRCLDPEEFSISYPRNFRLLRTLSIVQWFFPSSLHWRVFLDLKEKSFSFLNRKQRLEIQILLSSKEDCLKYLYRTERYSGSEIFGNFLGNDLRELEKVLRIKRKRYPKSWKKIQRCEYKDKGSRRPVHLWREKFDYSFTEYQNEKEKENLLLQRTLDRILLIIRES